MIIKFFIFIIILLLCVPCFSKTNFSDNFSDTSKISYRSNILISTSAKITNPGNGIKGNLISILITKQTNEGWQDLIITYKIPDSENKLTISILDKNDSELYTKDYEYNASQTNIINTSIDLSKIWKVTKTDSIKLKAEFNCGLLGTKSPILYSWKVTVAENTATYSPKYSTL